MPPPSPEPGEGLPSPSGSVLRCKALNPVGRNPLVGAGFETGHCELPFTLTDSKPKGGRGQRKAQKEKPSHSSAALLPTQGSVQGQRSSAPAVQRHGSISCKGGVPGEQGGWKHLTSLQKEDPIVLIAGGTEQAWSELQHGRAQPSMGLNVRRDWTRTLSPAGSYWA